MQPYSIDFRKKIIEVRHQEGISIRKLAQRFRVAKSFIQKLLKQYEETGHLEPQPQGGSPPPKVGKEQLITLIEIMENHNDATLEELCIENFWSKIKAILRKLKPRTYKDLVDAITEAMLKVTNQDIRNWFTHCCYCTS